ncbi:MAG: hypothetical protein EOP49_12905 [Sphingobacteriales bacterium]|nr:MAG: hypothetical protein EOP49_12905 [Sphingobacteriales bacterium]
MKTKFILLALLATTFFSACKKDKPEPADPLANAHELLQNKNWKLVSIDAYPDFMGLTDVLSMWDDCDRDDIYRFNPNGAFLLDAGATRCHPDELQQETGVWSYSESSKMLSFQLEPVGDYYALKLQYVDEISLVGTETYSFDNVEYIFTWVFRKQ